MNKVFCRKKFFFSIILAGYLILFNTACGLDTFYELESPTNVVHKPEYSSIDYPDCYFEFFTQHNSNAGIVFLGTDVYYKIYKSDTRLRTEAEDLQSLANKDDNTTYAANKMIETYHFQPLRASGYDEAVLFPNNSDDRVFIRLSNYTDEYPAKITVDGANYKNSSSLVIPLRSISSRPSFCFKELKTTHPDKLPKDGDADVNMSGSSSSTSSGVVWYVSMFAVGIGRDNNHSMVYSNILYLGSVQIPED